VLSRFEFINSSYQALEKKCSLIGFEALTELFRSYVSEINSQAT